MTYSVSKNSVTMKSDWGLFKVTENGAVRWIIYNFLLVRCKYGSILYRFLVIWRWIK